MTQTAPKLFLTFDDFITQYGDNERYELIDEELIEMEPTGPHEEITAFILRKINVEIDRLGVPWFTPTRYLIKLLGTTTAFCNEPIITLGNSIKLVVEVVSTK